MTEEAADPGLSRFLDAQQEAYPRALAEIEAGAKRSHWMWFIFPQIAGLGQSAMARRYAIGGLGEAFGFLDHAVLGARLARCTELMLGWSGRRSARAILGEIDALKFRSSMTLFERASRDQAQTEIFRRALDAFYQGEPDERTLHLLRLSDVEG